MLDVPSQSRRLGIALETNFDIGESFDSRSYRSEFSLAVRAHVIKPNLW